MSAEHETLVRDVVGNYVEPHLGMTLAAAGAIESLSVEQGQVRVQLKLGFPAGRYGTELGGAVAQKIRALGWPTQVDVAVGWEVAAHAVQPNLRPMQRISNILAVASGKGGVGKSTTAANLALGLAFEGAAVGLLDADIYGPSQPRLMGIPKERPTSLDNKTFAAPVAYGVKVMSIGFLIDEEQPMVWRGPMVTQALNQLLTETQWGKLDYLIVDMPPGTGDTQLTLSQRVPVSGAVIVTTPQDLALLDARKGLRMFQQVQVPVLGIIENMSTHVCARCGFEEHIFGDGGGARMAQQYGVELLGALPLDMRIREQSDEGRPTVVAEPDSRLGRAYIELARRTAAALARKSLGPATPFPSISVEET